MTQNGIDTGDEDRLLVGRILLGENKAFAELIKNNQRIVFSITFRMLNFSDQEDICQDIFIKAFKNLSKFKFESRLSTWIARIAFTSCVNHLRKRKMILPGDLMTSGTEDLDEEYLVDDIKDSSGRSPEELLSSKELRATLEREINLLQPLFKTVIVLYHQEELSYSEITHIMGIPAGTVKSYLFRARKLLVSNLLKKYKPEEI